MQHLFPMDKLLMHNLLLIHKLAMPQHLFLMDKLLMHNLLMHKLAMQQLLMVMPNLLMDIEGRLQAINDNVSFILDNKLNQFEIFNFSKKKTFFYYLIIYNLYKEIISF